MKLTALLYVQKDRYVLLYIDQYTLMFSDEATRATRSSVCTKGSSRTAVHKPIYFDVLR